MIYNDCYMFTVAAERYDPSKDKNVSTVSIMPAISI